MESHGLSHYWTTIAASMPLCWGRGWRLEAGDWRVCGTKLFLLSTFYPPVSIFLLLWGGFCELLNRRRWQGAAIDAQVRQAAVEWTLRAPAYSQGFRGVDVELAW